MCTTPKHRLYPLQERFSGAETAEPTEANEETDSSDAAVVPTADSAAAVTSEAGKGTGSGAEAEAAEAEAEAEAGSEGRPRSTVPVIIRAENAAALGVIVELRDNSAHFDF